MVDEILCYLASYLCYHLIQPFLPDIVMPHGQIGVGIPCGGYSCFHRCSAGGSTWPSAILISLLPSESCLLSLCYLLFLFCSLWATFWPTHQFFSKCELYWPSAFPLTIKCMQWFEASAISYWEPLHFFNEMKLLNTCHVYI